MTGELFSNYRMAVRMIQGMHLFYVNVAVMSSFNGAIAVMWLEKVFCSRITDLIPLLIKDLFRIPNKR